MDLAVKTREKFGKGVRALRREGLIPAELYGHGATNAHLSVPVKEFAKVFKEAGMNTVLTLLLEKNKKSAIIHDIMRDAVTDEVAHIDFYEVRMDEKIKAKVPLEFVGEASAVKEKGAVVNRSMTEIEVEALPHDLPHRLTIDLSPLDDLNKSVYVRDVAMPKGVRVLIEGETAIATATPPVTEEVAEAPVDVSEVKVESEEKKEARTALRAEKTEKPETEKPTGKPAQPGAK